MNHNGSRFCGILKTNNYPQNKKSSLMYTETSCSEIFMISAS